MFKRTNFVTAGAVLLFAVFPRAWSRSPSCCVQRPSIEKTPCANENLNALVWTQTSAEYRACALQAYNVATKQLAIAVKDPSWTALTEVSTPPAGGAPAIILDLDETALDNSAQQAYLAKNQKSYDPVLWTRWVQSVEAGAVPGAVEFVNAASRANVAVFYISNREVGVETSTVAVLQKLGFPVDQAGNQVLSANEHNPDDPAEVWTSDKTARRQYVGRKFRVLLLMGDQLGDFVADTEIDPGKRANAADRYSEYWGNRWIIVPNATYGTWESIISGRNTPREVAIQRKNDVMRIWNPPTP